MRSINKVILIGNATRDADLRQTTSGKSVSNSVPQHHSGPDTESHCE